MKRYIDKLRNPSIFMLLWLPLIQAGCAKVDGDYDFQNQERVYDGTTLAYFQSKKGVYDSLLLALDRFPSLRDTMATEEFTFFAPPNANFVNAFNNLNLVRANQGKDPLNIATIDKAGLDTLINKYLVKGLMTSDVMVYVDGLALPTLKYDEPMHGQKAQTEALGFVNGGPVIIRFSDTNGSEFVSQWDRTTTQAVDIRTDNGVVHILSNTHEFGFGEFLTRFNK